MDVKKLSKSLVFGVGDRLFSLGSASKLFVALFLAFMVLGGNPVYASTCWGESCGGTGESCYYTEALTGSNNICTPGMVLPPLSSDCTCDFPNRCYEVTMTCEDCSTLGKTCCSTDPKCAPGLYCNSSNTCDENTLGCDYVGATCCVDAGAYYCDLDKYTGKQLTCLGGAGGTCDWAVKHTLAQCVYNKISDYDNYMDCCDEVNEGCCGTLPDYGICYGDLKCMGSVCNTLGASPNCGTPATGCCSGGPTGQYCIYPYYLSRPSAAVCECVTTPGATGQPITPYSGPIISSISALLAPIFKILYYVGIFVGILGIIYSGYLFISSEGDPGRVKEGKEQFTAAILGSLFVLLSVFILRVIINNILGIESSGL